MCVACLYAEVLLYFLLLWLLNMPCNGGGFVLELNGMYNGSDGIRYVFCGY